MIWLTVIVTLFLLGYLLVALLRPEKFWEINSDASGSATRRRSIALTARGWPYLSPCSAAGWVPNGH